MKGMKMKHEKKAATFTREQLEKVRKQIFGNKKQKVHHHKPERRRKQQDTPTVEKESVKKYERIYWE